MTSLLPVVELSFAPIVTIGGLSVRLETIALAGVLLLAMVLAAMIARRTPVDPSLPPSAPSTDPDGDGPNRLRADDLLFIAVAAVPGAVAGARFGYWLLHLAYYRANPGALLDVGSGGLELSLGVVGGTATGCIVAGMLGAPVGRWLHALAIPLLLALAGGKAAMILGGSGQGMPWDGAWASAYLGDGPWGSLAPALPSYPSQALEAAATLAVLALVSAMMALGAFRRRSGTAFWLGLGLWACARAVVATTWRDPQVAGSLRMGQVISMAIIGLAFAAVVIEAAAALVRRGRAPSVEPALGERASLEAAPAWPEPTGQEPAWPMPTGPAPAWPMLAEPEPVEPAPAEPAPGEAAAVDSAPARAPRARRRRPPPAPRP